MRDLNKNEVAQVAGGLTLFSSTVQGAEEGAAWGALVSVISIFATNEAHHIGIIHGLKWGAIIGGVLGIAKDLAINIDGYVTNATQSS